MTYQAKNNAYSTLAGSLSNVATTLTVQAGHGDRFPVIASPNHTIITLEDASGNREIVKVTARASASDSMTIVRAQEGTTARAWASGDSVELRMTAGETQTLFDHIDDTTAAHAASAIGNTPSGNLTATTVQAALNELQTDIDTRELSINAASAKTTPVDADTTALIDSADANKLKKVTWSNIKATLKAYFDTLYTDNTALTNHINDTTDAHAASAITNTPAGNIAATTVQAAINELDSEKLSASAIGVSVQAYDADIPTVAATQAEMEAGTETALRSMSPARVKQAVAALAPPAGGITSLGSVAAASGNSVSLSGLDLSTYKFLFVSFEKISRGGSSGSVYAFMNSDNTNFDMGCFLNLDNIANVYSGIIMYDLTTKVITPNPLASLYNYSNITTTTTTVYFRLGGTNNFDNAGGKFTLYGVK